MTGEDFDEILSKLGYSSSQIKDIAGNDIAGNDN